MDDAGMNCGNALVVMENSLTKGSNVGWLTLMLLRIPF